MTKETMQNNVSICCRKYRKEVMKLTLNEMSEMTGVNLKTLSAFETGRSKNLSLIIDYVKICGDENKQEFMKELSAIILKSSMRGFESG